MHHPRLIDPVEQVFGARLNPVLPVSQQCRLLAVSRAAVCRKPVEVSAEDLAVPRAAAIQRHPPFLP
jgi:hypothetical protein